jgi:hypothetical protein
MNIKRSGFITVLLLYITAATAQVQEIKAGAYLYMEPGAIFYLSFKGNEKVNMVLFEIK